MNGSNIVADTSLLVNFFNGNNLAKEFIEDHDIWISGITEIEVLASSKLSSSQRTLIKSFISETIAIDLTHPIKEIAIDLRVQTKIKLPDAIIAATAIHLGFPLCSYDRGFDKIKKLNFILLEI